MLNQNTRAVLSQLGAINNSMIITYPVTCVIMGKNMQAFLDVSKIGEEQFDEIGVFNINEFNSVINVIEDPTIENNNGILTISNNSTSIKYGTTSIDIIESDCRGNPALLGRIKDTERNTEVLSFDLSLKELDRLKKMSGLLKDLSDLVISTDGSKVNIKVTSKEKSSNNYSVALDANVNEEASMTIIMDIINKLPSSNYNVTIYKSAKGSLVSVFTSTNVEGLDIVIAAKA